MNGKRYGLIFCLAVVVIAGFLFLFRLGDETLQDYDEAIYGQVISETAASGQWLTLQKDGPWFEKPPLYFWEDLVSEQIFSPPEFALRFPSALAGIISIVLIMLIAYEMSGSIAVSALAGLVLTFTPAFVEAGRQVRLDVPVVMAILFSTYSFIRSEKNPKWFLGLGAGLAIGLLTKSVIGLSPLLFILIWALVHHKWSWLKSP